METSRKLAKYDRLYDQIKQYIQTTEDIWARLATMEAVLHHKMQSFFWTGVYVLIDGGFNCTLLPGAGGLSKTPKWGSMLGCYQLRRYGYRG